MFQSLIPFPFVCIGDSGGQDSTQSFSGHIDEVRIWSHVRTAAEIQNSYHMALSPPYPTGLLMYYPFDNNPLNATCIRDAMDYREENGMAHEDDHDNGH